MAENWKEIYQYLKDKGFGPALATMTNQQILDLYNAVKAGETAAEAIPSPVSEPMAEGETAPELTGWEYGILPPRYYARAQGEPAVDFDVKKYKPPAELPEGTLDFLQGFIPTIGQPPTKDISNWERFIPGIIDELPNMGIDPNTLSYWNLVEMAKTIAAQETEGEPEGETEVDTSNIKDLTKLFVKKGFPEGFSKTMATTLSDMMNNLLPDDLPEVTSMMNWLTAPPEPQRLAEKPPMPTERPQTGFEWAFDPYYGWGQERIPGWSETSPYSVGSEAWKRLPQNWYEAGLMTGEGLVPEVVADLVGGIERFTSISELGKPPVMGQVPTYGEAAAYGIYGPEITKKAEGAPVYGAPPQYTMGIPSAQQWGTYGARDIEYLRGLERSGLLPGFDVDELTKKVQELAPPKPYRGLVYAR